MNLLLLAISFLSVIPVRLGKSPDKGDLGRAAAWFPWIGLALGGMVGLTCSWLRLVFPPLLAAALSAGLWIWFSGGLHLDGLADCFDGLFHPSNPERRLEIMKDPRLGSFGGIALILTILIKVTAVQTLADGRLLLAIPMAASAGRWLLLPAGRQPLARPGGMGADFASGLSWPVIFAAAVPVILITALGGWRGLAALVCAHLTAWFIFQVARKNLGGITGDVLGLTVELAELSVLLVFCLR